jgi:hypothetical protein
LPVDVNDNLVVEALHVNESVMVLAGFSQLLAEPLNRLLITVWGDDEAATGEALQVEKAEDFTDRSLDGVA